MEKQQTYLGDGVYAEYDGFHIILKTGSHICPDNTIFLDDSVVMGLLAFLERIRNVE